METAGQPPLRNTKTVISSGLGFRATAVTFARAEIGKPTTTSPYREVGVCLGIDFCATAVTFASGEIGKDLLTTTTSPYCEVGHQLRHRLSRYACHIGKYGDQKR